MKIENYLESTFLTDDISENKIIKKIENLVLEAIKYNFKLIMIRPKYISFVNNLIEQNQAKLFVGTVIDFPTGLNKSNRKIISALSVLKRNISDLDFVCDYQAFKLKKFKKFDTEILQSTQLCLESNKTIKWIIETGALEKSEIFDISRRISELIKSNFQIRPGQIYIKTSTGYYKGKGASVEDVQIIKSAINESIFIKASGGIKNREDCVKMINAGAQRIGTSSALRIFKNE